MTPCQTLKLCFPFLLLWGFMIIPLRAETYSNQLQEGLKLSYRHWNSEREEFNGFTHQEFLRAVHKGRQTTLETQINIKSDGEEPGGNPSGMNILPANRSNTWKRT